MTILLRNLFSKVVLVKNYMLAMQVAQEFNLTCVTPDLQIVYAGGFLTRVGQYNKTASDRVTLYRKVDDIQSRVESKIITLKDLQQNLTSFESIDLDAQRKLQRHEVYIS